MILYVFYYCISSFSIKSSFFSFNFSLKLVFTRLFPSNIPFASITNSSDSIEPVTFPSGFISTLVAFIEPSAKP